MQVITTDLYQAAYFLMHGARISAFNPYPGRPGFYSLTVKDVSESMLEWWESGQAKGNLLHFRRKRKLIKTLIKRQNLTNDISC